MRLTTAYTSLLRRRLTLPFVLDYGANYLNTVFLSGTARSGTTWLSEIINYNNEYRYIFEPFNCKQVPLTRPFGGRRYIRPHDTEPLLRDIMARILTGQIHSAWTERFNRRLIATRRLVKAVRANLLLKWLHVQFPGLPIILLIRHPCAVAHSYAAHGWRGAIEPLLTQHDLVHDFLSPYQQHVAAVDDRFERALFIWCIETLVPLKQFTPTDIHLMFYEHLITNPETEVRRLFAFLGKAYDPAVLTRLRRPSSTTRLSGPIASGNDQLQSWRRHVTDSQRSRALDIMTLFGLNSLYTETATPNAEVAWNIMRQ